MMTRGTPHRDTSSCNYDKGHLVMCFCVMAEMPVGGNMHAADCMARRSWRSDRWTPTHVGGTRCGRLVPSVLAVSDL
ncbi:hypothetical protein Taro_006906, partial [Colocasia esculenta]|nr:hypothetical protein [Colocasia esculenta]